MGTNFYWRTGRERYAATLPTGKVVEAVFDFDDPAIHIGKRSAAGAYCWDCRCTLCLAGSGAVHKCSSQWNDRCPQCGRSRGDENRAVNGAVMIEIGLAPPCSDIPVGVGSASSFNWAQDPMAVRRVCLKHCDEKIVVDEYGRELTGREFLDMLLCNCPIEFVDSIGERFS